MDRMKSNFSSERGQSLLEFALSLTILLILVVGIFDGARALFTYLSMRDAAQEGALYASISPNQTTDIVARTCAASNLLDELDCDEASICDGRSSDNPCDLSIDVILSGQACAMNSIRVEVDYPNFPLTMPLLGGLIGAGENYSIPISAWVTDTIIIPSCP